MNKPLRFLEIFAGIGAASLAADRVWEEVDHTFVEINPFGQTILRKHWPKATIHGDIKTFHTDGHFDLLWGSPPCQAASSAGKRKGTADSRWLWPDTFRVIREARPRWYCLENVRGLLSLGGGLEFDALVSEMENLGYEVWPFLIPACAVGAPHRRDRVWILGHRKDEKRGGDKSGFGGLGFSEQEKLGGDTERICIDKNLESDHKNDKTDRASEFTCESTEGFGSGSHKPGQVGQPEIKLEDSPTLGEPTQSLSKEKCVQSERKEQMVCDNLYPKYSLPLGVFRYTGGSGESLLCEESGNICPIPEDCCGLDSGTVGRRIADPQGIGLGRRGGDERPDGRQWVLQGEQGGGSVGGEGEGRCGDVTDTDAWRLRRHERESTEERSASCVCGVQSASDTSDTGLQGNEQPGTPCEGEGAPRPASELPCFGWNPDRFPDWNADWKRVAAETCTRVHRMDDGAPKRLYRLADGSTISEARLRVERLKACGNAVVTQVVEQIFRAIKEADKLTQ